MNNIKIVYDTMNDLPENMKDKYDIDMLPTTIIFQSEEYKAGVDIDNDEFYKLLRENKEVPTTSQVTYMTFKETFEKYLNEGKKTLSICSDILSVGIAKFSQPKAISSSTIL